MAKKNVFFHIKTTQFDWEDVEDLKGIVIGATLGYNYGEVFQVAEKEGVIRTERVTTDEQNFKKLLLGRFSVFICNFTTGYGILNKMYDRETVGLFSNHPKPISESYNSLILSNKTENQSRMVKFNSGLKKLKESGRYDLFVEESRQGKYK